MISQEIQLVAAAIAQARQATEIGRNAKNREAGVKAIRLTAIGIASHLRLNDADRLAFMTACGL